MVFSGIWCFLASDVFWHLMFSVTWEVVRLSCSVYVHMCVYVCIFGWKGGNFKNIYFCFINYKKAFRCVGHSKLGHSWRGRSPRPPHLSPRNLYASREATVRTSHGAVDWFKLGKGVREGCMLSACLNSHAGTSWATQGQRIFVPVQEARVLIPGWERSPGEGNGSLLQYSCLGNPMDGGGWRAAVHGVAQSQTRLSS